MLFLHDERHAELQDGEFTSLFEAVAELRRRSALPWNEEPNVAPCTSWQTAAEGMQLLSTTQRLFRGR